MNDQMNHSDTIVIYVWLMLIVLIIVLITFSLVTGFVL
jgi:hypothetical protein